MSDTRKYLDAGSLFVIALTLVLFILAIFVKGIGHDLLLEAGVFLVSVKLIIASYDHSLASQALEKRLHDIQAALQRLERVAEFSQSRQPVPSARTVPRDTRR